MRMEGRRRSRGGGWGRFGRGWGGGWGKYRRGCNGDYGRCGGGEVRVGLGVGDVCKDGVEFGVGVGEIGRASCRERV